MLLPGQRHDIVGVPPLIKDVALGSQLNDKGFDSDALRTELDRRGAVAVLRWSTGTQQEPTVVELEATGHLNLAVQAALDLRCSRGVAGQKCW